MKLSELLKPWINSSLPDCDILGIEQDSRKIKPGDLFVAYKGLQTDGRLFIPDVVQAGVKAVIYQPENWPQTLTLPPNCVLIPLPELAQKRAAIASRFYNYPARQLSITGITGTNGKTTIAYQLAEAHESLGTRAAYIGTIGQGRVGQLKAIANTTPDPFCLQQLLANYQADAIKQVSMEVSSHALSQQRVDAVEFEQAIFTNLSHDHLDYHLTMNAYAKAKSLLFANAHLKWAIINQDDGYSGLMQKTIPSSCQAVSYGMKNKADVVALNCSADLTGSHFDLHSPWGKTRLHINTLGLFNIYNAMAVFSSLMAFGYELDKVSLTLAKLTAPKGRMEIIAENPFIVVDYAHTPDALENALLTLHRVKKGRLGVVFGCGGDRDKSKRPLMGKIACQYADFVIITNDNPRTEDPLQIINDIESGIGSKANVYKIPDRKLAILQAMQLADKRDLILVAGKGHENYQEIGLKRYPFSDQEIIKSLL